MTPSDPRASAGGCGGAQQRRTFLRIGSAALGGLTLPGLLRLEAAARAAGTPCPGGAGARSVIVVWLWGGPSHMDTFDMKPEAPSEFRGELRPIRTTAPGIEVCELLPLLARQAHRFALLRSVHHDSPGHVNSTHTMLTGYPGEAVETPPYRPSRPDFWSVAQRVLGPRLPTVPGHVALPSLRYPGAAYLRGGLEPFGVAADPGAVDFSVPGLAVDLEGAERLRSRAALLERFDGLRRGILAAGEAAAAAGELDVYRARALELLTSGAARNAFAIEREDERVRERYGRNVLGQRCLLARRLVEAGVRLVTIDFPCVPGQKAFSWDDHASVWNIFDQMRIRLPVLDQAVSALIEDLHARGLDRDTLLLVLGEMSHTPRLSSFQGQPGREHWARSMTVFAACGGLRTGQAIGATTAKGEEPRERPLTPNDLLATWYRWLGVPLDARFPDFAGRPVPILPSGEPIEELLG